MKQVIKPCPFCGQNEDFDFQYGTEDKEGTPINVICSCSACGPWVYVANSGSEEAEMSAIEEWNRRVEV